MKPSDAVRGCTKESEPCSTHVTLVMPLPLHCVQAEPSRDFDTLLQALASPPKLTTVRFDRNKLAAEDAVRCLVESSEFFNDPDTVYVMCMFDMRSKTPKPVWIYVGMLRSASAWVALVV